MLHRVLRLVQVSAMLRAASSFRFAARRVRPGVRFAGTADGDGAEARLARFLAEHDLASLPPAPPPAGLYRTAARDGRWLVVSGHAPYELDGSKIVGKIADESDEELARGHRAARHTALAVLATLRKELGSLDRVERVLKTLGMVNCGPDFGKHPRIIDGYSEVMRAVFGDDRGVGVRSAVGVGSLPGDITTECEGVFVVREGE